MESLSGVSAAAASFPLWAARTSRYGRRLDLDHDARLEKALDAEQCAHWFTPRRRPDGHQLLGGRHDAIDVGGVEIEPDDVRRGHVGGAEHLHEVRPGELELCDDVAGVLRSAAGVVRRLAGDIEHSLASRHLDRLVDVE